MTMSFGENLRLIRKERRITQEQLAEMLDVSRQAISKWESESGYPETEKLILLSQKLNVSIDYLVKEQSNIGNIEGQDRTVIYAPSEKITIASFDKNHIVACQAVKSSKVFGNGKAPAYVLLGVEGVTFWGEHNVILGWYKTADEIQKEIAEIYEAMKRGETQYELKYFTKVEYKGLFGQPHVVD
ncbi:MAG: helix-turn-helix domain-containing protein [Lachnospiraceae bacterium]|nr:helix-turn-helix domain-containing protein [Lachnospiraceae bacterium]